VNRPNSSLLLLGVLPFLYVAGVGFSHLPSAQLPLAVLAFLVTFALSLYLLLEPRRGPVIGGLGLLLLALELLLTAGNPAGVGVAADEAAWGILLASPIVFLLLFVRSTEGVGVRLVGLQVALADGVLLLSIPSVLSGENVGATAGTLVRGAFTALDDQVASVVHLILGQTPGPLPMETVTDPWYTALAALALLATLFTFLRPVTGRDVDLPTYVRPPPGPEAPEEIGRRFGAKIRELLAARSVPRGPPPGRFPGIVPILGAGIAGAIFLGLAYSFPAGSLLVVTISVFLLMVVLAALLRRPIETAADRTE
jgi:hypothetical protein